MQSKCILGEEQGLSKNKNDAIKLHKWKAKRSASFPADVNKKSKTNRKQPNNDN